MEENQFVIPRNQEDIDTGKVATFRPFQLFRPCECGCDFKGGVKGVGYLNGVQDGTGVTVWIETEEVYQGLKVFIGGDD